jgi:hypothetical protein
MRLTGISYYIVKKLSTILCGYFVKRLERTRTVEIEKTIVRKIEIAVGSARLCSQLQRRPCTVYCSSRCVFCLKSGEKKNREWDTNEAPAAV